MEPSVVLLYVCRPGARADALLDQLAERVGMSSRPRVREDGRVEIPVYAANGLRELQHVYKPMLDVVDPPTVE
jgi:hypothetical protein